MGAQERASIGISKQLLIRLPNYLNYLKTLRKENESLINISAPTIAAALGQNEVQVRKDLAAVSSSAGKPKTGFCIKELIHDIESFLGYDSVDEAVLAGAGNLGRAFLSYKGFDDFGLKILMAFDKDEKVVGQIIAGKHIMPIDRLQEFCQRLKVNIGIITVPAEQAQEVCDQMVRGGILAIWNFAPIHLSVPDHVLVHNENMVASLAKLSNHLAERMSDEDGIKGGTKK
ncbi:MAG: redox-sensing transcriptional repressor Rex [Firmicutes bacterium HGW-Firmicutes-11]|jgi:redox-sensing transcriptional repressor|nr:MAG: redox-sensing transcriptional repressor Rex [Firmicutes bacterium HGW-Firmicutes-11]